MPSYLSSPGGAMTPSYPSPPTDGSSPKPSMPPSSHGVSPPSSSYQPPPSSSRWASSGQPMGVPPSTEHPSGLWPPHMPTALSTLGSAYPLGTPGSPSTLMTLGTLGLTFPPTTQINL
jgi:hypothetical protein